MSARDLFSEESLATVAATCGNCVNGTKAVGGFIRCTLGPRWRLNSTRQACEITPSAFVALPADRIAKRDAQAGIDQAVAGANREISGWADLAYRFITRYAERNHGKQFIGHDIVQASIAAGVAQPSNPKAWGAPIQRAARDGVIVRIGFAPDPNRHTNPVPLWTTST